MILFQIALTISVGALIVVCFFQQLAIMQLQRGISQEVQKRIEMDLEITETLTVVAKRNERPPK